jgi:serine/threonine-protein kinase HipA
VDASAVNTAARELLVSINHQTVGNLREEANVWSFAYAPDWIASPEAFDLSPQLPRTAGKILDGATLRHVQWFFDNLLPEEQARDILAREANIRSIDAFGLLAYYGKESAGAITLLPPGEQPPDAGYVLLTDEELHERILKLPRQSLSAGAPKHMSTAGAQHKLGVSIRDGKLFHPAGDAPSTHLLKPNHIDTESWPHSAANEYFCMRLAAQLGLDVPPVQIRYVPEAVYLIERFDRVRMGEEVRRLHIVDACQLLGLDRAFKYQQANVETLVRCIEMCENRARSRQNILAWVLFNLLTGNGDAHLKNLSFRVSASGIAIAPFYDLVSTESYRAEAGNEPRWPERPLSMTMGTANSFAAVRRSDFLAFADQLGVNRHAALRLLEQFIGRIEPAAQALYEELESADIPLPAVKGGQLRVLRTIRFAVIRDMLARLR